MDPVNFLEIQKTHDKCRSTASNTVPISCGNCGAKDYSIQTFQQANCSTSLFHGMPGCKVSADIFKDNFPIHPHLFSRPFFQPVFHNSSILSNAFYGHHNIGVMLQNPHFLPKEAKCESNSTPTQTDSCSDCILNQSHQAPSSEDEIKLNKNHSKASNKAVNATEILEKQCKFENSDESGTNYPAQCICNNSSPWIYSPFILPIISYYILWNSQCSSPKLTSATYSCKHSQMRQTTKINDEPKTTETSPKEEKDETNSNDSKEKLPKQIKVGVSEDFWTDDKTPKSEWNIKNQKNGSSSSFFSISSLDYEDIFYTKRKSEAKTIANNNSGSEHGAGKLNAQIEPPKEHKDSHDAEADEKVKPAAAISTDIEEEEEVEDEKNDNDEEVGEDVGEEDRDDVKDGNNSLVSEITSDSKIANDFEGEIEILPSETQLQTAEIPSQDPIIAVFKKSSQETHDGNDSETNKMMSDYSESMFKDRVTCKKLIKNFTMADETNSKFYEESKTSSSIAAGGDLGGEHCVGYRIDISSLMDQQRNVQHLRKNENETETNEIFLKDAGMELTVCPKEKNENNNNVQKKPKGGEFENELKIKTKTGRTFKSGIAKLSNNFKAKYIDSNLKKTEIINPEQKFPKTRRKHDCAAVQKRTENNETKSNIEKFKNSRERQGKKLDSARENVPPNKLRKQSAKSTDYREKKKEQKIRAPFKSSFKVQ